MSSEPVITREIMPLPVRRDEVHKGSVGHIIVIGGSIDEVVMAGAPALTANAAFRSGAGLVQLFVPEVLRPYVAVMSPCSTVRTIPNEAEALHDAVQRYEADVVAIGPGLGSTLDPKVILDFLARFEGHVVIDADGLNQLARIPSVSVPRPDRTVLTPHPGELKRLLSAHDVAPPSGDVATARCDAALLLQQAVGGVVVLKGRGTVVTDGARMYINETGNSGMATGGMGDVLTGVIAGLIGQKMAPMEAAILSVFLHGLAGDFAAEELGRYAMTALDVLEYLPEAFREHEMADAE